MQSKLRIPVLGSLALTAALVAVPFAESAGGQEAPDLEAFCRTRATIEALFGTNDEQAVETALLTLKGTAPPEIAPDATVVADQLQKKGEDAFGSKKFRTALTAVNDFALANCVFNTVAVTGVDFAFEGIPESIPPGPTAFTFTNTAPEEEHEIVIFRLKPSVTDSAKKLLALSERKLEKKVEFVTATFAAPGASDVGFANLEPGRYIASCFVPVQGSKGKPHWREGMYSEFEVPAA